MSVNNSATITTTTTTTTNNVVPQQASSITMKETQLGMVMPSQYHLIDKLSPQSIYAYHVRDDAREKEVAMKIYGNLFSKDIELMKSVWNELFLIRAIELNGGHPNIVKCLEFVETPDFDDSQFNYAAIVCELMDADLHFALQHNKLNIHHARYCLLSVLNAINYLHERHLVHQNISSRTVLVTSNFDIKLTNFKHCGNVNHMSQFHKTYMTANVKNYRAPEILIQNFEAISLPVDIFAAGCLLAEIILGKPLFEAKHYLEQLEALAKLLGAPDTSDLTGAASELAMKSLHRIQTTGLYKTDTFAETFPSLNVECPDAIDLLKKMLAFNPRDRISVTDAINHPFFDVIRDKVFVRSGEVSSFRSLQFHIDTYYERPLLMKNLIYNELVLGQNMNQTRFQHAESIEHLYLLSDVDIICI